VIRLHKNAMLCINWTSDVFDNDTVANPSPQIQPYNGFEKYHILKSSDFNKLEVPSLQAVVSGYVSVL
jgi:hypothetical protein